MSPLLIFSLHRITDPSNPFFDCLSDAKGEPLRFDPENHPAPPQGDGVQLCYRALPNYEKTVLQRKKKLQLSGQQMTPAQTSLLQGKNQAIVITTVDELAHLYLQEFYNKRTQCDISELDIGAILNIFAKASCFPVNIKKQASKVRDDVRNKWAHAVIQDWTSTKMKDSFSELTKLAQMLPGSGGLLKELNDDLKGAKKVEQGQLGREEFLLIIDSYRTSVENGNHMKIDDRIKKLGFGNGQEIYLERRFKETGTGRETTVEDLVLKTETVLVKGVAGAGKSSVAAKIVQQWAQGIHLKGITCCLFLAAGSEEKIPLIKIIWDEHILKSHRSDNEAEEVFYLLQDLADQGKLAIIVDGLDELGTITTKDIATARRAATHTHTLVDIKTVCAGILSQDILPGAKVLATGRSTELINKEVLGGKAILYELIDFTESDRNKMVEMMEQDPNERIRIESPQLGILSSSRHHS